MVRMLTSNAVDREFVPRLWQTKDYEIGICRFSSKHAALKGVSAKTGVKQQSLTH